MGWDRSDTEGNLGIASAAFGLASMLVGVRIPTYLAGIPWPQGQECRRLTLLTHAGRIPIPGGRKPVVERCGHPHHSIDASGHENHYPPLSAVAALQKGTWRTHTR